MNAAITKSIIHGKGLGGSSAINFGVYTVGCQDAYKEWARMVDDSSFACREQNSMNASNARKIEERS
jgi:hypothetical protein